MITKECAIEIQKKSLSAIAELTKILIYCQEKCSQDDFGVIKKGVGISIGEIQMELLEKIYVHYPELDDLEN